MLSYEFKSQSARGICAYPLDSSECLPLSYVVPNLDSNLLLKRTANVVEAEIDGHIVVMSIETGVYLEIGGAGKKIWEYLEVECTLSQLVDQLTKTYSVDPDLCLQQTSDYLQELEAQSLIKLRAPD
ncbi:MAG: hypothetical protein SynsKO_22580 [Synoicihabitans sp.]